MKNYVNYKSFKFMFKKALYQYHTNLHRLSNRMNVQPSYLYHLVNHDQRRVYIPTLKRIGAGLGMRHNDILGWIHSMSLIHPLFKSNGYTKSRYHHNHKYYNHVMNKISPKVVQTAFLISKLSHADQAIIDLLYNRLMDNEQRNDY